MGEKRNIFLLVIIETITFQNNYNVDFLVSIILVWYSNFSTHIHLLCFFSTIK